jgi:hypothetical protein
MKVSRGLVSFLDHMTRWPIPYSLLAVKHMCFVKNRIPGPKGIPLKVMKGESMRFELMWPFGIRIWYKKTNAGKLDEKAELGTYVGVAANQKGSIVQNKFGQVIDTRDYKVAGETQRIDHVEEKSTDLTVLYDELQPNSDKEAERDSD